MRRPNTFKTQIEIPEKTTKQLRMELQALSNSFSQSVTSQEIKTAFENLLVRHHQRDWVSYWQAVSLLRYHGSNAAVRFDAKSALKSLIPRQNWLLTNSMFDVELSIMAWIALCEGGERKSFTTVCQITALSYLHGVEPGMDWGRKELGWFAEYVEPRNPDDETGPDYALIEEFEYRMGIAD